MSDVKDYSEVKKGSHFRGVGSFYADIVNQQVAQQPKYCEPGKAGGEMQGAKKNTQAGPAI